MSTEKKQIENNPESWFIPEDKEKIQKYLRGADDEEIIDEDVKAPVLRNELLHHKEDVTSAARSALRSELLHTVEEGYIESEVRLTQKDISSEIPIAIASRKFDFNLPNGPYHVDVTKNGRTLLLGGENGHFASFDWYGGKKFFEVFPDSSVRDVSFLHDGTMSAMATSKSVLTFDKNGVQIHEIRDAKGAISLEFLPKHWLLVAATENSRLVYLDITDGKSIATHYTKFPITCMCQNPYNAVICTGHDRGSISMWTPNQSDPVARIMKHPAPVKGVAVDLSGYRLAAGHGDGSIQIWDIRNFDRTLINRSNFGGISDIAISAKGVLGIARGNYVEMYKNFEEKRSFLNSKFSSRVTSLKFVTFDDFAICGLESGISSIVVPGSGEPNIDSNVANPYETVEWRQEQEVRRLLDKIPPNMISLNPDEVFHVGKIADGHSERVNKLKKKRVVKDDEEKPIPAKNKQVSMEKKLQMMKEEYNRRMIEEKMKKISEGPKEENEGVLSRFKKSK